jgi:hypothetical protein
MRSFAAVRGVTLVRGRVQVGNADFTVEIDPTARAVIHWKQYEYDRAV